MVFMVASTNLVIELGIVLWLLIGWQFAVAEFVGGAIMIAALGVLLPRVVPAALAAQVRARDSVAGHDHGEPPDDGSDGGFRARLRQPSRWVASAGYTIADLRMVRREIVIGFVLAGFLAVAVPMHVWSDLFLTGHGPLTTIENAIVGPFVAIISFVCSIGNVALASALWTGGISFGGVIAFLFADLITIPLLLMYRTMYGGRITLRLVAVLWPVMSASGLITELLFRAAGGVPTRSPTVVATEHVTWNYTTVLNLVFVLAFAALLWLHRQHDRFDNADAHAVDPVCRMQVEKVNAAATIPLGDETVYFCSERCRDRFAKNPARSSR